MSETYGNDSSIVLLLLLVLRANECWPVHVCVCVCVINIIIKDTVSDSNFYANIHWYVVLS